MQKIRLNFAIAAVGFAVLIGGRAPVEAAPLTAAPLSSVSQQLADQAGSGAVEKVHYRRHRHHHHHRHFHYRSHYRGGYCRDWRWRCADRWDWHTPRYRHCLRRHGC
jgi:hypothetical protein